VSIWRADGTLTFSTYQGGGPSSFQLSRVPEDVVPAVTQMKLGSIAHLWLTRELVAEADRQRRKPPALSVDDEVLEYELVSFDKAPEAADVSPASSDGGLEPLTFPPPDAAGPPRSAVAMGTGAKYVVLRPGSGPKVASPDSRVRMRLRVWQVHGLLVDGPLLDTVATTTAQRAPAVLQKLVATAQQGQVFRIWLSAERAREAVPSIPAGETVCDLGIQAVSE
jgi:hypothetical protein